MKCEVSDGRRREASGDMGRRKCEVSDGRERLASASRGER